METSDSECFESADEEFYPENEKKHLKKQPITEISKEIHEIRNIKISQSDDTHLPNTIDYANTLNKNETNINNKKKEQNDNKSVKPSKIKISKLGVKVSKTDYKTVTHQEISKSDSHCKNLDSNKSNSDKRQDETNLGSLPSHKEDVEKEEINMWDNDADWEPVDNKDVNYSKQNTESLPPSSNSWMGWGNWDVSSLLNTATAGVSTLTSHVSQGLTTVLETGIGAPDPVDLARQHTEQPIEDKPNSTNSSINLGFGLGDLVSGVTQITKLVETTGNKVISGGLDTLETIGKKTMQVLQEGDPGFKKKKALLKINSDRPVLSHILREAKEKAEFENKLLEEQKFAKKANYESLFDDHQGLVHLEALEMLSKQCSIKLERLLESQSGNELIELQETMNQIIELCELVEDEEELEDMSEVKEKIDTSVSEMHINISYDKLLTTWNEAKQWLENLNLKICTEMELHEQAIDTLAQLTALAVERYHKIGELLLIKDHRSTADEADSLVQLTMILTTLISNMATILSNKLNEKLSSSTHKAHINTLITNVYFESANSSSYIKNAFQLLIPVLQVGAI